MKMIKKDMLYYPTTWLKYFKYFHDAVISYTVYQFYFRERFIFRDIREKEKITNLNRRESVR